ncbi:MAG: alkane 1-monooxygenase [Betaproteobacteria bacterium]|nr:alkane 1-monooxygenase [Betaproteobacteria bacterium]
MRLYPVGYVLPWLFATLPLALHARYGAGPVAAVTFLSVVALERLLPPARTEVPRGEERAVADSAWYKIVLRGYVPLQLALMTLALLGARAMSPAQLIGSAMALGLATGSIGITFAHELGHHRRSTLDRVLAHVLMACVGYGQFMVEHYRGHHERVATPDDPATARRGETVYAFWWRTIPGQLRSAWQLEAARLGTPWAWRNVLLWHLAWAVIAPLLIFAALGTPALVLWLVQAITGILLLETVNYIEHYGLRRQWQRDGTLEPVGPAHSWNTYAQPTNWILVHLQRHSDHHMYPGRPYPLLRTSPDAPELPTGYTGCILLALMPPLWFRAMHRRLDALRLRQGARRPAAPAA